MKKFENIIEPILTFILGFVFMGSSMCILYDIIQNPAGSVLMYVLEGMLLSCSIICYAIGLISFGGNK